jgi:hypothetical protein
MFLLESLAFSSLPCYIVYMIKIEEMKIANLNVVDASGAVAKSLRLTLDLDSGVGYYEGSLEIRFSHEIDEGWHSISGLEILSAENENEESVSFGSVDIGELEMKVLDLLENENIFEEIKYFLK